LISVQAQHWERFFAHQGKRVVKKHNRTQKEKRQEAFFSYNENIH